MQKIKILGVIAFICLIGLIILNSKINSDNKENQDINNKVVVNQENVEDVINNGGSILKYNGFLYYVKTNYSENGKINNMICKRNIKTNIEEILYSAGQYKMNDRLIIFNNNIFFSIIGQTYYINLENPIKRVEYNKGILYYIGDGNLIYAYNDNLFKATYYLKTLAINSIDTIATFTPNYMLEDKENLYFYSLNSDESISIIRVNKNNQAVSIIDRIYKEANTKIEILDYELSQENLYLVLKNVTYQIRKIPKKDGQIEFINEQDKISANYIIKDKFYYKLNNDTKLYVYDEKENKKQEVEKIKNLPDIYNVELDDKNIYLCKNEENFVKILENAQNELVTFSLEEVEDNVYIRLEFSENAAEKRMLFRVKKDGNDLEKM